MMKKIIQFILAIIIAVPVLAQGTVELEKVPDAMPGTVNVSLTLSDFTDEVGAITLYTRYNADLLTFLGYTVHPDFQNASININPAGCPEHNCLVVTWTNLDGGTFSPTIEFMVFEFTYEGGFDTELAFVLDHPDFEIADTGGNSINGIIYEDGFVKPAGAPYTATFTIGSKTSQVAGSSVSIPVTVSDLDDDTAYSANLYIGFDSNLAYVGTSANNAGFNVSSEDGIISLARANSGAAISDGEAIKLNFTYLGAGDANISFLPGSVVGDSNGDPLHVGFEGGKVTQSGAISSTFAIQRVISDGAESEFDDDDENIGGVIPAEVTVGVTNSDALTDVGAVQLYISYDTEKLEFKTLLGSGWAHTFDPEVGIIQITRQTVLPPINLTDDQQLFELLFEYNVVAGNPESLAEINFLGGSFVQYYDGNYVNMGFANGWVNTGYELDVKVFLEGAYDETSEKMKTDPIYFDAIPTAQPYNMSPWDFDETVTVQSIPNGVIDWILVELRDADAPADAVPTTKKWIGALFLMEDGSVVDLDGESKPVVSIVPDDNIYVIIHHRNHIGIMSAQGMTLDAGRLIYDFTYADDKTYQNASAPNVPRQADLGNSHYGMFAGDVDQDTDINIDDIIAINIARLSGDTGYLITDILFEGVAGIEDIIKANANRLKGVTTHIPQ